MKHWCLTFCLVIASLFGSVGVGWASAACEGPDGGWVGCLVCEGPRSSWNDCFRDVGGNSTFYEGTWRNGQYHIGRMTYFAELNLCEVYTGEWKNNKRHGLGICKLRRKVRQNGWKTVIKEGLWKNNSFQYATKTPYSNSLSKKRKSPNQKKISAPSLLGTAFKKLPQEQRKIVQTNLKDLGLYKSSIDGLYGKSTAGGLKAYNKEHLGDVDLKKSANAEKLIHAVLALKPAPKPKIPTSPVQPKDTYKVASGTGFYVSDQGHIITNHHVIDGCKNMKVHSKGKVLETLKIAHDELNDLALLKISGKPSHVFALSSESAFPLQDIVVAGFPFGDEISSSLKFTRGIVSSLTGIGNNYSEIQIDAALQPGNSGGPIMDDYGNIIGVAVAKLDIKAIIEDYGVIPENTNFGVKSSAVRNLMEGNGIPFKSPNTEVVSKRKLSQIATDGTVFLTCWMTLAQIEQMRTKKVLFKNLD